MTKVLFFLPVRSRYETLHVFSRDLAAAFQRQGIDCLTIDLAERSFGEILHIAREEAAALSCCFNGVLPDAKRGFLSDFLDIPHLTILVDPPYEFLPLKDDPYGMIACVDAFYPQLYSSLGYQRSFFLPHAIPKELLEHSQQKERPYDITLLGTYLPSKELEEQWKSLLPTKTQKLLREAAELVLADNKTSCLEALSELTNIPLSEITTAKHEDIPVIELWVQVEKYTRGRDRLELLQEITNAEIHVFGKDWDKCPHTLPNNVTIHDPINYSEALDVMRQSKILINSVPVFKQGSHERLFAGPACGAAVLANDTLFLQENFEAGKDILSYLPSEKEGLNDLLQAYLDDDVRRNELVNAARTKIQDKHTWDHRVSEILEVLQKSPLLN